MSNIQNRYLKFHNDPLNIHWQPKSKHLERFDKVKENLRTFEEDELDIHFVIPDSPAPLKNVKKSDKEWMLKLDQLVDFQ